MAHTIVISEFMDQPAVDLLRGKFDVVFAPDYVRQRAELLAALKDVPALIVRNLTQVNRELLDAAPRLKVVGRLGVGLDNIDLEACAARGIKVIPATGANALSVAEYTVCTAMLLLRTAYRSTAQIAGGHWLKPELGRGREVRGKTMGIIGYGCIGRLSAGLARPLGMKVIGHDINIADADPVWNQTGVAPRSLAALLTESDIVTLHVPLIASTRNLLDAANIAKMRLGAVLINTSRGGIIDEAAVVEGLKSGRLGGAAIDVFEREPLAATPLFADVPNLLLTPHIAGITQESNQRVSDMIAAEISAFLERNA
jgi:(S)-sulfolactate dehydrogenase